MAISSHASLPVLHPNLEEVCNPLTDPTSGQVIVNERFVGSVATYSCDVGFELVGNETRTCQSGSTWSGAEPSCRGTIKYRIMLCQYLGF